MSREQLTVLLAIVLHVCITLPLCANLNIWVDEAYTMNTTDGALITTINKTINYELQPPAYFIIMNLWRRVSSTVFFARLFSVVCAAITIYLVARMSKIFFPSLHKGWITMSVALNPFLIWAAVEMRLYALLILLSALLLLTFYHGFISEFRSHRMKICFVLLSILSLYTQYYTLFLLAALFVSFLILKRGSMFRSLITPYIIIILCSLPLALIMFSQLGGHTESIPINNSLSVYLFIGTRILRYPFRLDGTPTQVWAFFYAALCAILLVIILKYHRNSTFRTMFIVQITICLILMFLSLINIAGKELLTIRHTAILFIPSMLTIFSIFYLVPVALRKGVVGVLFIVMISINTGYLILEYQPMAKMGDFKRVADFIKMNESQGQPVFVYNLEGVLPLKHYYTGRNSIVPLPANADTKKYNLSSWVLKDENEIIESLKEHGASDHIWLVTWRMDSPLVGVNFHPEILSAFIEKHCVVVKTRDFYDAKAQLLHVNDLFK